MPFYKTHNLLQIKTTFGRFIYHFSSVLLQSIMDSASLCFVLVLIYIVLYCRALTKRSISQNFQNEFFSIIHISLSFSILCQKILDENHWQSSFMGSIKTLYPIFRVGFDNQNTLSSARVYNT